MYCYIWMSKLKKHFQVDMLKWKKKKPGDMGILDNNEMDDPGFIFIW